jgi:hypothetical protein
MAGRVARATLRLLGLGVLLVVLAVVLSLPVLPIAAAFYLIGSPLLIAVPAVCDRQRDRHPLAAG